MIVAGFIIVFCFVFVVEYKLTTHTVCAVVVCATTPGTALMGRAGAPQAAARRPASLVLCREWQHKPFQRRPYHRQFLYPPVHSSGWPFIWKNNWQVYSSHCMTIIWILNSMFECENYHFKQCTKCVSSHGLSLTNKCGHPVKHK